MKEGEVRRIVTGHDRNGKAVVLSDGPAPFLHQMGPRWFSSDIWRTHETPARITAGAPEPTLGPRRQLPTKHGTVIRIGTIPPESEKVRGMSPAESKAFYEKVIGNAAASQHREGGRHALMHRTETVDYAIVIEGEITMVMDDSEVTLRAGDVLVQRGTNHAWSNRSDKPCKICFVLIDGQYDGELGALLKHSK